MIQHVDRPTIDHTGDQQLKARVLHSLAQHHIPGVRALEIRIANGVVTLRGRVASFYHKQLCVHGCWRVVGVAELVDELQVASPTPVGVRLV